MIINTVKKCYVFDKFTGYLVTDENGKEHGVPLDEANTDYQAIQEWIQEGNTVIDNGGNS